MLRLNRPKLADSRRPAIPSILPRSARLPGCGGFVRFTRVQRRHRSHVPVLTTPFSLRRVTYDPATFIRNDTQLTGLLGMERDELVLQYRERNVRSQGGLPLKEPGESEVHEVRLPVGAIRRVELRRGWLRTRLVLAAADLRAFEPLSQWLTESELVLSIPRAERTAAADLASSVELALSTRLLGEGGGWIPPSTASG